MSRAALAALLALSCFVTACRRADEVPTASLANHVAHASAATPDLFTNGGFETGSLNGWTVTSYVNNSGTTCGSGGDCSVSPPANEAALNLGAGGANTSRAIEGIDGGTQTAELPIFNGKPATTYPFFGSWAALVNESSNSSGGHSYNINKLSQSFATTASDIDPADGNIHVRFVIAPALENGNHTPESQPYYFIQVSNTTQGTILRTDYAFANQPGLPFQAISPDLYSQEVDYTNWLLYDVAPGGAKLAVGDTVQVDIIAAGCALGGHAGEVTVDGFGSFIPGLTVVASAPSQINVNSPVTYTYTVRNGGTGTGSNVVVDQPILAGTSFASFSAPTGASCTAPAVGATSGDVICNLGPVNPSATTRFSITLNGPSATGDLPNGLYSVKADGIAPLIGSKVDTSVVTSGTYADLSLTINDGVAAVSYGSTTSYRVVASNAGPAASPTVSLMAGLPAEASSASWSCGSPTNGAVDNGAASGTGNLSATLSLPANSSITCIYTVVVANGSGTNTLNFVGSVTDSATTDPQPNNNTASDQDQVGTLITVTAEGDPAGKGSGSLVSSPAAISCTGEDVTCSGMFAAGVQISVTATASAGSIFTSWTSGPCAGSTANQCTFTPQSDTTVEARFDASYSITASSNGNGTIVCPNTSGADGASPSCTLTPASGYALLSLTDNGVNVAAQVVNGMYTINNISGSHTLVATFGASCTIDTNCPSGDYCSAGFCAPKCTTDTSCGAGNYCTGASHCAPKLTQAAPCTADDQCGSAACVDGVCCNSACAGACQACDVAGAVGTCTTLTSGEPHGTRASCASDKSVCGGSCTGASATICSFPSDTTACRAASCTAGVFTAAASCAGNGTCPAMVTASCGNYGCNAAGTACNTGCATDAQCGTNAFCSAGVCSPKGSTGSAVVCTANDQCGSGFCTDGYCCDSSCTGQCQACNVPGKLGTCSPDVAGDAPHGTRAACANDASGCGGACDGTKTLACAYPGAATACRAGSCDAGTAIVPASCNGAGACPVQQTQSCNPYVCGATACDGNCASDSQCATGNWCAGGVCAPKLQPGSACGATDQCASGFCTDGVCCDTACDGQCQACNVAGAAGTCSPAPAGSAPIGGRSACATDGSGCGGACDGTSTASCAYPASDTNCRAGTCSGGVATAAAGCNGAGSCPPAQTVSCDPYSCGLGACAGNCIVDSQCTDGNYCAAGVCTPKAAPGAICGATDQCASGNCVDGFCCDTACDGQCAACDVVGHVGTCSPVPTGFAPHGARQACAADGSSCGGVCGGTETAACVYPTDACREPFCASGVATLGALCDGQGHCPAAQTQACGAFACGASGCIGNCAADNDCSAGNFCASGICRPKIAAGQTCAANDQCGTGECVDGVCCDTACNGQCQACDVAGHIGTCSPATGAPHGARTVCSTDGSDCGGSCDGSDATACTFPGASTQCRGAVCSAGVATAAASCNGAGQCPAVSQSACGSFGCEGTACGAVCSGDGDCASGSSCVSNKCVANGTPGTFKLAGSGGCSSGGAGSLLPLWVLALFAAWQLFRKRSGKLVCAAAVTSLALLAPLAASAQTTPVNTQLVVDRFQPGAGAFDVLAVGSAQTPESLDVHLSAWFDYANQPLRLLSTGTPSQSVILLRYQSMLYLGASIGLFDRFELGVVAPFLIAEGASNTPVLGTSISTYGSGVGDIKLVPKAKVFDGGRLRLAVALPFTLPTGAGHAYLSQGYATFSPELRLETNEHWLPVQLTANAGVALRTQRELVNLQLSNAFTYGLAGQVPFAVASTRLAFIATWAGELGFKQGEEVDRPMEVMGALRWFAPANVSVTVGAGPGITEGYGTPRFRVFAGVSLDPSREHPVLVPAEPISCLLARDTDVTTPENTAVACPIDAMAQSGAPVQMVRVEGGPAHGRVSNNNKSVPIYTPENGYWGKDQFVLVLTDGAGRLARQTVRVDVTPPPPPPAPAPAPAPIAIAAPPAPAPERAVRDGHIALLTHVNFATDRDVILPDSLPNLEGVAKVLRENADFRKVRVDGHTDNVGGTAHNKDLSLRRAKSVREYLIKAGISGARLEFRGFGESTPLADNKTEAGRARNRRVEFVVIDGPLPEAEKPAALALPDPGAKK